jgi:hypothetical protein
MFAVVYARVKATSTCSSNMFEVHAGHASIVRAGGVATPKVQYKETSIQDWIIEIITGADATRILPNQLTSRYKKL